GRWRLAGKHRGKHLDRQAKRDERGQVAKAKNAWHLSPQTVASNPLLMAAQLHAIAPVSLATSLFRLVLALAAPDKWPCRQSFVGRCALTYTEKNLAGLLDVAADEQGPLPLDLR